MSGIINVTNALKMIKSGDAILIDVREPDEFKTEHIPYALSIPLSSLEDGFKFLDIPNDKTIFFQCLKGTRGQTACERIEGLSLCNNNIMNIDGGIDAWKENNLPVITLKTSKTQMPIMRQVQAIVGFIIALSVIIGFTGITIGFILAGILGAALFFAGITGWCGMAILLSKMPWNK